MDYDRLDQCITWLGYVLAILVGYYACGGIVWIYQHRPVSRRRYREEIRELRANLCAACVHIILYGQKRRLRQLQVPSYIVKEAERHAERLRRKMRNPAIRRPASFASDKTTQ